MSLPRSFPAIFTEKKFPFSTFFFPGTQKVCVLTPSMPEHKGQLPPAN
jgi:hypothetical protein